MYSDPDLSYLFLVISIETMASAVFKDYQLNDQEKKQFLIGKYGKEFWDDYVSGTKHKDVLVEKLLNVETFSSRKFREFIIEYLPDRFFLESSDEARPRNMSCTIGHVGPTLSDKGKPVDFSKILPYEKYDKSNLKKIINSAYNMRSKFVHESESFPKSILLGLYQNIPVESLVPVLREKGQPLSVPTLRTIERIAGYTIKNFLLNH